MALTKSLAMLLDSDRRWQICSPKVSCLVSEFEELSILKGNEHSVFNHHENTDAFQKSFKEDVNNLSVEITKLGNPFKGKVDKKELVQLGTKDVMGEDAVKTVMGIEELGKKLL